jgi:hypothetical protein
MTRTRTWAPLALGGAMLLAHAGPAAARQTLSVGGFNATRGGLESFQNSDLAILKAAIQSGFPGTKFHYRGQLTSTFLATVNVVVVGAASGNTTPITPLSTKEKAALLNFVKSGGTAIVFADNNLQFQTASNSLLVPFGLRATGVLSGDQTGTFLNVSPDPVRTGKFGTAAQLDTGYPGWFAKTGSSKVLAKLAGNGRPVLAYLPAGALGSTSGAAVFFGNSSLMIDGFRTSNDQIAILNALALTK